MTIPVETKSTAKAVPAEAKAKARRKPAVKRDFNELGKFFAKIRIDAGLTTSEWAQALGVSQLSVTNIERSDVQMSFNYAMKVAKLVQEKTPHYTNALASVIAGELGVLLIPTGTTAEAIEKAYFTLLNFDKLQANQTKEA